MSEADAQVWQSRRRDAVVIPLDVVAQHQAIDIRLVGNHSPSEITPGVVLGVRTR